MSQCIKIIHYKAGNIASVTHALSRLGVQAGLATSPDDLKGTDKLIFPGVGHAKPAMEVLRQSGMDEAIRNYRNPVLGICLGMQLMAEASEEGPMEGLGIFPGSIKRFSDEEKVPHMGWNSLYELSSPLFKGVKDGSHVYFVHSYYLPASQFAIASSQYGARFTASIAIDNYFGVQFHPEKSGTTGALILKNFLAL